MQHTFLYISLLLFCTTTTQNFLVTHFIEEMLYVCMCFFFHSAHFHLSSCWHFSFSHPHYKIFMFFFQQNLSPLLFISCSCSFSVIHVSVDIKIELKKDLALLLLLLSKSQGGHVIFLRPLNQVHGTNIPHTARTDCQYVPMCNLPLQKREGNWSRNGPHSSFWDC